MKNITQQIDFELPNDISVLGVIYDILKRNNIQESDEEWLQRHKNKKESKALIIRDSALVLFKKQISEDKLAEILAQHLGTTKEISKNIISDIKQKLIPYARIFEPEKETSKLSTQKVILEKIKGNASVQKIPVSPEVKNIQIKNVEKNAEKLKKERGQTTQSGTIGENLQKRGEDKYREVIG
jgi:hypothetical protein